MLVTTKLLLFQLQGDKCLNFVIFSSFFIVINKQGTRALLGVLYPSKEVGAPCSARNSNPFNPNIYSIRHQIIEFFYILFRWWISIASVGDFEGLTFGVYLANIRHLQLQGRQTTTTEVRLRIFWRKISTLLRYFALNTKLVIFSYKSFKFQADCLGPLCLQRPLFSVPAEDPYVCSYFNLPTTATSRQRQQQ